jgi:hypothetical protein
MAKRIWTLNLRLSLYSKLVEKFGSYDTWGHRLYPVKQKNAFFTWVESFANTYGITPNAVHQQIAWAVTTQQQISGQSKTYCFILNVASAHEAGFVRTTEFPTILLNERKC